MEWCKYADKTFWRYGFTLRVTVGAVIPWITAQIFSGKKRSVSMIPYSVIGICYLFDWLLAGAFLWRKKKKRVFVAHWFRQGDWHLPKTGRGGWGITVWFGYCVHRQGHIIANSCVRLSTLFKCPQERCQQLTPSSEGCERWENVCHCIHCGCCATWSQRPTPNQT